MDGSRFDNLAQQLAQTRITRLDALRGLVASAVVGLTAVSITTDETEAKKKSKARKAKKEKNGGSGNGNGGNGNENGNGGSGSGNGNGNGGGNGGGTGNGNGNGGNGTGNGNGNENKFQLCHCPPGNPNNCHTISVGSQSAVNAHLANHPNDSEGACEDALPECEEPDDAFNCVVSTDTVEGGTLYDCTSSELSFGPTGWAGWSCPPGMTASGGSTTLTSVFSEGVAAPGATWDSLDGAGAVVESGTYPEYPHYTFAEGEEGYVVQNDNDSETGTITVQCLAACAVPEV